MTDRLGALGGTLHVTSTPGHGTTVSGTVPLSTSAAEDASGAPAQQDGQLVQPGRSGETVTRLR